MSGIQKAGDVNLSYVTIRSANGNILNVTSQVETLKLYEDIFENFISGQLVIRDSQALAAFFPLVGQEFVSFDFVTPSLDESDRYSGEYYIYKCSDKVKETNKTSIYILSFISKEAIIDLNKRISKTFKGNPSDMITYLLRENGLESTKELTIEPIQNSFAFISNWWNPTRCIQYIAEHSKNSKGIPNFVFFENRHEFSFLSLDSIMDKNIPIFQEFVINNYTRKASNSIQTSSVLDPMIDYQTIMEIEYGNGYDYIDRIKNGYYGGKAISFDLTTQRYFHRSSKFDELQTNHLNSQSSIPSYVPFGGAAYREFIPKMYNPFNDYGDVSNLNFSIERKQSLERLRTTKITIKVHGRTDYNIGKKVNLTVPLDTQTFSDGSDIDRQISGTYIITSIAHCVSKGFHTCYIELMKDSYMENTNDSMM